MPQGGNAQGAWSKYFDETFKTNPTFEGVIESFEYNRQQRSIIKNVCQMIQLIF